MTTPTPPGSNDRRPETGPVGGMLAAGVLGLAERFRLPALVDRHSSVAVLGAFAAINGLISIGLMATAALATGNPLIFPSLGPTAFLLFYTPLAPASSPRNTLGGHLIGALAGYLSLAVFGLLDVAFQANAPISAGRVGAAALSLGLTSGAMVWLKVPHPPAGATTLIVALGILREPWQLAVLMLAVTLLVLQGYFINRLAGLPYPRWRAPS
ncbi:MAG: HPP family protein [Egicoccus sp.]